MPNMTGTVKEKLTGLYICLMLDAMYIVPLILF
jgi:hypothetical protein